MCVCVSVCVCVHVCCLYVHVCVRACMGACVCTCLHTVCVCTRIEYEVQCKPRRGRWQLLSNERRAYKSAWWQAQPAPLMRTHTQTHTHSLTTHPPSWMGMNRKSCLNRSMFCKAGGDNQAVSSVHTPLVSRMAVGRGRPVQVRSSSPLCLHDRPHSPLCLQDHPHWRHSTPQVAAHTLTHFTTRAWPARSPLAGSPPPLLPAPAALSCLAMGALSASLL